MFSAGVQQKVPQSEEQNTQVLHQSGFSGHHSPELNVIIISVNKNLSQRILDHLHLFLCYISVAVK